MRINELRLNGCKAFIPGGIRRLIAQFPEDITIITGENGSGKSSLLEMLKQKAHSRGDFVENVGSYYHNITAYDTEYEVSADFSHKHAYRFHAEGDPADVPRNIGAVQQERIAETFGINAAISDLITLEKKMSALAPTDRRNWILGLCPTDLTFFIKYHKRVVRKYRDANANIKLLTSKLVELERGLITEEDLNRMVARKQFLETNIETLSEITVQAETNLARFVERRRAIVGDDRKFDWDVFTQKQTESYHRMKRLFAEAGEYSHTDNPEVLIDGLREYINKLTTKQEMLYREGQEAAKRLSDLEELASSKTRDEHAHVLKRIADIKSICEEKQKAAPNVPAFEHVGFDDRLRRLSGVLECIREIDIQHVYPERVYDRMNRVIMESEQTITNLGRENDMLEDEIKRVLHQADADLQLKWNAACNYTCDLKTRAIALRKEVDERVALLRKQQSQNQKCIDMRHRRVSILKSRVPCGGKAVYILAELESIKDVSAISFLFGNLLPWQKLRSYRSVLVTQLEQMCTQTQIDIEIAEFKPELERLKYNAKLLEHTLAKQTDDVATMTKTAKDLVDGINVRLDRIEKDLTVSDVKHRCLTAGVAGHKAFEEHLTNLEQAILAENCAAQAKLYHGISKRCEELKRSHWEELRGMESTVEKQSRDRDYIQNHIRPDLERLQKDAANYKELEKSLSPKTGVPFKYMVKYLNQVIEFVNSLLAEVWTYEIEICPLPDDKPLTFEFPWMDKGVIRPDIKKASTGQREIMDTLISLTFLYFLSDEEKYPVFFDETGKSFDPVHQQNFVNLVKTLIPRGFVSQIFMVSHFANMYGDLPNSATITMASTDDDLKDINQFLEIVR